MKHTSIKFNSSSTKIIRYFLKEANKLLSVFKTYSYLIQFHLNCTWFGNETNLRLIKCCKVHLGKLVLKYNIAIFTLQYTVLVISI